MKVNSTVLIKKIVIANLFRGFGDLIDSQTKVFDTLIVDEAHRLNHRSGLYGNLGESQVKEIIHASRCSVFLIDEDQRITLSDAGTVQEIHKWADRAGAAVTETDLAPQFRCYGSDGYLAWIDQLLRISETANQNL